MFEIENRFKSISRLISSAEQRGLEPETASYFCKLGAILVCGAVERSIEIIIVDYVGKRSAPQVTPFLRSFFKRGKNYSCADIVQLLYNLDGAWAKKFESSLKVNERWSESLSSCYAVRNSVAHGGGQSLGTKVLRQYYEDALSMIVELENIIRSGNLRK